MHIYWCFDLTWLEFSETRTVQDTVSTICTISYRNIIVKRR